MLTDKSVKFEFKGETYEVRQIGDGVYYKDVKHIGGNPYTDIKTMVNNRSIDQGFRFALKNAIHKLRGEK